MITCGKNVLKNCIKCASIKFPNYQLNAPMGQFKIPNDTMKALSIDVKGTLPTSGSNKFRYIITAIDLLSRYERFFRYIATFFCSLEIFYLPLVKL